MNKKKTLIFCTYYGATSKSYLARLNTWILGIKSTGIEHETILIVDDASPFIPDSNFRIFYEEEYPRVKDLPDRGMIYYRFLKNLGRSSSRFYFPGWYRSFWFALHYAKAHRFDKVIHIESDAAILSKGAEETINNCNLGWFCFNLRGVPESGIQIIHGKEAIDRAYMSFSDSYLQYADKYHETLIPIDGIIDGLFGDRFSDPQSYNLFIPKNADYAMQLEMNREKSYYWWINKKLKNLQVITDLSPREIKSRSSVGWSVPELNSTGEFIWMTGNISDLRINDLFSDQENGLLIIFYFHYFIGNGGARFSIYSDKQEIMNVDLMLNDKIGCELSNPSKIDSLFFIHPDAFSNFSRISTNPAHKGVEDERVLAVAVQKISLFKYV